MCHLQLECRIEALSQEDWMLAAHKGKKTEMGVLQ